MTLKQKYHKLLGNVNFGDLNILSKNNLVEGLPNNLESEYMKCGTCIQNKMTNTTRVKNLGAMYGQYMGHVWLWRLSGIWAIVFPHNVYNVAHTLRKKWHKCGHYMGNSVANIRLRHRSHILPVYCANVGSVANILSIYCPYYCQYMGSKIIFRRVVL